MQNANKILGFHGEHLVAAYLQKNGFSIIAQNYRKRYGEIDLIGQKNDLIVFVEVKTRKNPYVDPAEVILPSKQKKIIMVAKEFISSHTHGNAIYRFDVALVECHSNDVNIEYIENAFFA